MTANIKLTRYTAAPNALPLSEQQCWPVTIVAVGVGISSKVFVYRGAQQGDPFGGDAFSCVASVNQLYELPEDTGYVGDELQIPFYRRNTLELFCRSQVEADYIWQVVNEDITNLLNNFNLMSALQGTATSSVTAAGATVDLATNLPQKVQQRIQLNYQPAGTATLINNLQDMINPDTTLPGWLPAASAPSNWSKPNGAKYFYNIDQDSVLQAFWPLPDPVGSNQLFLNGALLPYGVVYVVTQDTIWWLDFDPTMIVRPVLVGMAQQGNAPWPADYVDANNPGNVSPQLVLLTTQ